MVMMNVHFRCVQQAMGLKFFAEMGQNFWFGRGNKVTSPVVRSLPEICHINDIFNRFRHWFWTHTFVFLSVEILKVSKFITCCFSSSISVRQPFHRSRTAAPLSGEAESSASPWVLRNVSGVVCWDLVQGTVNTSNWLELVGCSLFFNGSFIGNTKTYKWDQGL